MLGGYFVIKLQNRNRQWELGNDFHFNGLSYTVGVLKGSKKL